jgi:hypothetical protein
VSHAEEEASKQKQAKGKEGRTNTSPPTSGNRHDYTSYTRRTGMNAPYNENELWKWAASTERESIEANMRKEYTNQATKNNRT